MPPTDPGPPPGAATPAKITHTVELLGCPWPVLLPGGLTWYSVSTTSLITFSTRLRSSPDDRATCGNQVQRPLGQKAECWA